MKFKVALYFIVLAVIALAPINALTDITPRPIFATSITNQGGIFYIPTSTPLNNRACYFDNDSIISSSVTTATELSYLHGVVSPVQAQINGIVAGGGVSRTSNTVSSNFSIPALTGDYVLNVDTSGGAVSITMPSAMVSGSYFVDIKNIGTHTVTIATVPGQTIDGQASTTIDGQWDSVHLGAIGGQWYNY